MQIKLELAGIAKKSLDRNNHLDIAWMDSMYFSFGKTNSWKIS